MKSVVVEFEYLESKFWLASSFIVSVPSGASTRDISSFLREKFDSLYKAALISKYGYKDCKYKSFLEIVDIPF